MNVLVTGGRSPYTLSLIKFFVQAGHKIYVAESFKNNMSGASRVIEKNILVAPPALETKQFVADLIKAIHDYKIELLIPTCEENFYISMHIEELSKHCKIFTSGIEILKTLHSKYKFVQMLKEIGVEYPNSILVDSIEKVKEAIAQRDTFVLKPEFSRFASYVIINDKSENKISKMKVSTEYPWVLQDFIKGKAFCSYSVAQEGKLLAHSIYPSIYCAGQGATVHFESVNVPQIDEIVMKIVKHFNYTGQISFDFIQADSNGICYPIECNPRSTSGIYLFAHKDKLPLAFTNSNLNNVIKPTAHAQKMVGLAMILYCLPKVRSINEARDFISKMLNSKDVILNISDIKPFIAQFLSVFSYVKEGRKKNLSIMEVSTLDIEWNGT